MRPVICEPGGVLLKINVKALRINKKRVPSEVICLRYFTGRSLKPVLKSALADVI